MKKNKRSIPEIRVRLRELADQYEIPELHDLANETYRSPPIKRAANQSAHLTPQLAEDIRHYVAQNPTLHQRDVAQRFNVNPGRISEALNRLI
jgi:predicted XRE-type DNA-binding protein